jgi:hypothetical protein
VTEPPSFAWNHGDVSPDINTTWLGMVGPGVKHEGVDGAVWSDHTDVRPTILALTHLSDDYSHDGRVLVEDLKPAQLRISLREHEPTLARLADVYKQLQASVGELGLDTLHLSTIALASNSPGDATYAQLESQISTFGSQRDLIASRMRDVLEGAAFDGVAVNVPAAKELTAQGQALLDEVHAAAVSGS